MDIREFELLARHHLHKIGLSFALSVVVAGGSFAIADWAKAARGWQSEVVEFIFYAVSSVAAFSVLYFGIAIYSWFAGYRVAKSDAAHFQLGDLQKFRGDVIGPIRWK